LKDTPKGRKNDNFEIDFSKEHVEKIVNSYNTGKPFLFCGIPIRQSEIEIVAILRSEKSSKELLLPNKKTVFDEKNLAYIHDCMKQAKVEGVTIATDEFDFVPLEGESVQNIEGEARERNEVFIVHGRDDKQALLLQKHLREKLGIKAKMFEDFKEETGSNTIIELLEYIWKKARYAFIIATPDDCGVLHEEFDKSLNTLLRGKVKVNAEEVSKLLEALSTRARQNVVFEFGLFMGAFGRDKVCCLLQESTQERPSDIDGVLYTPFSKSVDEKFDEIDAKLKSWLGKKT
jgi:predicted nucleotide-binding protein